MSVRSCQLPQCLRKGFSLVEVTLALGIVSFALLAILGTLGVALNSSGHAARSGLAGASASHLMASLRAFPEAASDTANFPGFPLPALTANLTASGTNFVDGDLRTTPSPAEAEFHLRYRITPDDNDPKTLYVTLDFEWPPQAASPVGSERLTGTIRLP